MITSTWTFAATVNVIEHVGAKPVLVDVEPDTLNMDPRLVEKAITPRTRVVLSALRRPALRLDALHALCDPRGINIVDDAAHALGAAWRRPGGLAREDHGILVLRHQEPEHRRGRGRGHRRTKWPTASGCSQPATA